MSYNIDPRTRIKEVFSDMLLRQDFCQITLASLCREVDIAKTTFYHYYPDKYSLVADIILDLFSPFFRLLSQPVSQQAFEEAIRTIQSNLWNNRELYKKLFSYGGQNSVYETLFRSFSGFTHSLLNDDEQSQYFLELSKGYAFASLGLTKCWLMEDVDFSNELYTRIIADLCPAALKQLLYEYQDFAT